MPNTYTYTDVPLMLTLINIIPIILLIVLIILAAVPPVSCPEKSYILSKKDGICIFENGTFVKTYISNESLYASTLCAYLTIIPILIIVTSSCYFLISRKTCSISARLNAV